MAKVTRTIKLQVSFPGWRSKDLSGKTGLWYQLSVARGDITRAANRVIEVISLVDRGLIDRPEKDGKPMSMQTMTWRLLNGTLCLTGEPTYVPNTTKPLSGTSLSALSNFVWNRYRNDRAAARKDRTRPLYSTFSLLPIFIPNQGLTLLDNGDISMVLWGTGERNGKGKRVPRLTVRPAKVSGSKRAILARLRDGTYKLGEAKLLNKDHKWFLAITWTDENVEEATGTCVAGIDLGIATSVVMAYRSNDGEDMYERDFIHINPHSLRAWEDIDRRRKSIGRFNRKEYGLREGHGRGRKLRPLTSVSNKKHNVADTAVRQVAAATIKAAKKRGAHTIVLEDLKGITERYFEETEEKSERKRARARRKRLLQWHQYALRTYIAQAAEREGLAVVKVDPRYTSKTCSKCGVVWTTTIPGKVQKTLKQDVEVRKPTGDLGRHGKKFKCSCGHEEDADLNAARNIAARGVSA